MKSPIFFNAHHSPVGAFATLTFGCKGATGGLGLELKEPANENLYIGVEDIAKPGLYHALPFYSSAEFEDVEDYDVEGLSDATFAKALTPFQDSEIERQFAVATDEWKASDLCLKVFSPPKSIPDPASAAVEDLKWAVAPVICAELTIDNRMGSNPRKAFFGFSGSDRRSNMVIHRDGGFIGVGQGRLNLIATDDATATAGIGFQPEAILDRRFAQNANNMLGKVGLIVCQVEPGEIKTIRFAVAFYVAGIVTTGIEAAYLYNRYFSDAAGVAKYGLQQFDKTINHSRVCDRRFSNDLTEARRIQVAQAVRSYYGCTQLLERRDAAPLWVVNEGEYRMMNTFDLTVDHLFLELAANPWTVRNVLDLFVERYSYRDNLRLPGLNDEYPGGLCFTHDMGVANSFSESTFSCYEQAGLKGVFSYMSAEELVNWILCAGLYTIHTNDLTWANRHLGTFRDTLDSLCQRDHPDANQRNGIVGFDSSRCQGGAEITTYDSLDPSLGQARNNTYLAVKCWSAYVLLARVFESLGDYERRAQAVGQANLVAETLNETVTTEGLLPAVIGEGNLARLIPAIEGLVYANLAGCDFQEKSAATMKRILARHLSVTLSGTSNRFSDGGWKLSSSSDNSWLSKVYLCQFVAEQVFDSKPDADADSAHLAWLMDTDNAYFAWSDQMVNGKAVGSRYYPRGVTSLLWLIKGASDPVKELSKLFAEPSEAEIQRLALSLSNL